MVSQYDLKYGNTDCVFGLATVDTFEEAVEISEKIANSEVWNIL